MKMASKSVLLDADVIIHFYKGGKLGQLPEIVKPLGLCLLQRVYNELRTSDLKSYLDKMTAFKLISEANVEGNTDIYTETIQLSARLGIGESACLAYARFNGDVIASSNLSDIKSYCQEHNIEYLTTMDLLAIALEKGIMSVDVCNSFIMEVSRKGSKLLVMDINYYKDNNPSKILYLN